MASSKSLTYLGHVCESLVCEHTWSGGRDAGRLDPGACWHWPAPTTSRASWSNWPTAPTRLLIQVVVDLLMVHAGHPLGLLRLLSKFTLEVSFRLLNPFHFFFQNTEFRCGWSCVFKMELFFGPINLVCVKRVRNCAMWVCKNGLPQRQWQIDNEWWIKYLVGVLHYQDLFFFRFLMWWWWRRMWIRRYARQARRSFFTELNKGKKKQ